MIGRWVDHPQTDWSMLLSFSTLSHACTRHSPLAQHLKRFNLPIFIFGPRSKRGSQTPFPPPPPNSSPYSFLFSIHIRRTYSKVQTPLADNIDLQVRLERKAKQGGPPGLQMSMFPVFPFVFRH